MEIDPAVGGSIRSLRWNGVDILRSQTEPGVLGSACFPLVPFCNRIPGSAFEIGGRRIELSANHPTARNEPVLHGFGWLSEWQVEAQELDAISLLFTHRGGEWPWRFEARQTFKLHEGGVIIEISLTNQSDQPMPAGLGIHPFLPRDNTTILTALHRGERQVDGSVRMSPEAIDWWGGRPVGSRIVDTTYVGRCGDIGIRWPDRGIGARLVSGTGLPFTHVYVPAGEHHFCVEPVSHLPEAFASRDPSAGWRVLAPRQSLAGVLHLNAYRLVSP